MAREGSKTAKAIAVMVANKDKSMEEVLPLIAEATGHDLPHAKNYYVWCVRKGVAPGVIPTKARQPKVKVSKAVKLEKLIGETLAAKPKAKSSKALDEIKDIKAKNLETMKKVGSRVVKKPQWAEYERDLEAEREQDREDRKFISENFGRFIKTTHPELAE